jgi:hypothetical protein
MKTYIDKIEKVAFPNQRYTNFAKIIDEIQKKSVLLENRKSIVTIISDFYHETNTDSFYALENSIKKLTKQAGDNLIMNLIVLAGKSNNEQYIIDKTKLLISEYCKFVYYYEYEQGTLLNQANISSYISSVVKYPQRNMQRRIVFYYPFEGDKYEEIKKTKIKFESEGIYTLNIRNESLYPKSIFMQLTSDNDKEDKILLKSDYPVVETINNNYTYTAQIQTENIPRNVFLEISNSSSKIKNQIPIVFRELVPKTVCYVLVLAYTLCSLLLCIYLFFFAKKFKICKHTDNIGKLRTILYHGLSVLCFIPLIILSVHYLRQFWSLDKSLFWLLLFIILVIGAVACRVLMHECFVMPKKCIEKGCRLCLPSP